MKTKLLFILVLLPFVIKAQLEFAPVGAKWIYDRFSFDWMSGNQYYALFIMESEKDTVINNISCKKINSYTIDSDNGQLLIFYHKPQYVFQNGYRVYHLIDTTIFQMFDFNPDVGQQFFYPGWNIEWEVFNAGNLEFKVNKISVDSSITFKPKRIEAEVTCSVSSGHKLIFYEKLGYLNDAIFYSDAYCITDQYIPFNLRCYIEPGIEVNLDSIDCDSIRPDIIWIRNVDSKEHDPSVLLIDNSILLNSDFLNIQIYDLKGQLHYAKKLENSIQQLDLTELPSGIYIYCIEKRNGTKTSGKFLKKPN